MKFYFAGSIQGGRQDVDRYARIVGMLKKHGRVLSEHVADPNLTSEGEDDGLTDREIHDRDLAWIGEADALVADVSSPSHGVGYEIAHALIWRKPVLCLFWTRDRRRPSAMLTGRPDITFRFYDAIMECEPILVEFVRSVKKDRVVSSPRGTGDMKTVGIELDDSHERL